MVALAEIQSARERIGKSVIVTPCTRAEIPNELISCEVFQNRSLREVKLQETEVELLFETRGLDHVEAICQALLDEGFILK